MNDFLTDLASATDRGSMVLVTERRRDFGPLTCKGCGRPHDGGTAHTVIVRKSDDVDARWLLWVFAVGFSVSDETANESIPIARTVKAVPAVRTLRFVEDSVLSAGLEELASNFAAFEMLDETTADGV